MCQYLLITPRYFLSKPYLAALKGLSLGGEYKDFIALEPSFSHRKIGISHCRERGGTGLEPGPVLALPGVFPKWREILENPFCFSSFLSFWKCFFLSWLNSVASIRSPPLGKRLSCFKFYFLLPKQRLCSETILNLDYQSPTTTYC